MKLYISLELVPQHYQYAFSLETICLRCIFFPCLICQQTKKFTLFIRPTEIMKVRVG